MTELAWPLERNTIRRDIRNNAFGTGVRDGGTRDHQGWDLVAAPMIPCYAIADGRIVRRLPMSGDYGNVVVLEFTHRDRTLYAAYCHLSFMPLFDDTPVTHGDVIAYTGNTGNASTMRGEDQHLHFEIRTVWNSGPGLANRIDPATLYGRAPIGWTFFEGHGEKVTSFGERAGLKATGINVR